MIKHIVLFKLAAEAEGNSKSHNAQIIKEQLEALKDKIEVIRKIEVSLNHAKASPDNYDLMLDSEFDSWEDLQHYIVHPEHQKVGKFILKVKEDRVAIDYEF